MSPKPPISRLLKQFVSSWADITNDDNGDDGANFPETKRLLPKAVDPNKADLPLQPDLLMIFFAKEAS